MAKDKCILAYSGGLDTSVCLKWLQDEKGLDVIAVVGEVGQEHEGLEAVRERALSVGALDCIIADMRDVFVNDYLTKALAANAQGTPALNSTSTSSASSGAFSGSVVMV